MALINCPECNKQISDKAEMCPNCGFKLEHKATYQPIMFNINGTQVDMKKLLSEYPEKEQAIQRIQFLTNADINLATAAVNDYLTGAYLNKNSSTQQQHTQAPRSVSKSKKTKTKLCKHCQAEVPKKATVCPNCKRNLSGGVGCLTVILGFFIFCGLIVFGIGGAVAENDAIQRTMSGTNDDSEYISMEEYNKIDTGMTYEQVKDIVGSAGEVTSQVESGGYKIVMITWYGNGIAGSNANVTFTNNKVTGKAQFGLE